MTRTRLRSATLLAPGASARTTGHGTQTAGPLQGRARPSPAALRPYGALIAASMLKAVFVLLGRVLINRRVSAPVGTLPPDSDHTAGIPARPSSVALAKAIMLNRNHLVVMIFPPRLYGSAELALRHPLL